MAHRRINCGQAWIQSLRSRSLHSWMEKENESYPAKSGPAQDPKSCTIIHWACLTKSSDASRDSSTSRCCKVPTKPPANPAHRAGGYSLRALVAHTPSLVSPIATLRGTSLAVRHALSCGTISVMFSSKSPVGFLLGAPHSPCEISTKSNSGHERR